MSTYLYLECHEHQPPITSDGEVGQHLYDLPAIRGYIENRGALATVSRMDGVLNLGQWPSTAARFLTQHPDCPVHICDEYGKSHPIEELKEDS